MSLYSQFCKIELNLDVHFEKLKFMILKGSPIFFIVIPFLHMGESLGCKSAFETTPSALPRNRKFQFIIL